MSGNLRDDKQAAKQRAQDNGFDVIVGGPFDLLLDIDNGLQFRQDLFEILCNELPGTAIQSEWTSKDGKGKHLVIKLPVPLDPNTRFALQACLGSDPKREILGVLYGICPSMLFKPREAANG